MLLSPLQTAMMPTKGIYRSGLWLWDMCAVCAHRDVMRELADKEGWPVGWAFDGRKNMYSPELFLPQHETQYEVRTPPQNSRAELNQDQLCG